MSELTETTSTDDREIDPMAIMEVMAAMSATATVDELVAALMGVGLTGEEARGVLEQFADPEAVAELNKIMDDALADARGDIPRLQQLVRDAGWEDDPQFAELMAETVG